MKSNLAVLAVFVFLLIAVKAEAFLPSHFHPGQRWSYHTRPGERDSYLLILKVEPYTDVKTVVHVAVMNLRVKNPLNPERPITEIVHLAMDEDMLWRSVIEQTGGAFSLPEYAYEYENWKKDRALVKVPVAEAVRAYEKEKNKEFEAQTA